jgi:hypothetical protein
VLRWCARTQLIASTALFWRVYSNQSCHRKCAYLSIQRRVNAQSNGRQLRCRTLLATSPGMHCSSRRQTCTQRKASTCDGRTLRIRMSEPRGQAVFAPSQIYVSELRFSPLGAVSWSDSDPRALPMTLSALGSICACLPWTRVSSRRACVRSVVLRD